MYLVPINEHMFVNPNNIATLLYEGPNTTRIVYSDGRSQDRVEMPIQKLADILNGEEMRYIITADDNGDWWCTVPGADMHMGLGKDPEAALQDAKIMEYARNPKKEEDGEGTPVSDDPTSPEDDSVIPADPASGDVSKKDGK